MINILILRYKQIGTLDNIKADIREVGCDDVDWIHLAW
jgi:hypothetical protein